MHSSVAENFFLGCWFLIWLFACYCLKVGFIPVFYGEILRVVHQKRYLPSVPV